MIVALDIETYPNEEMIDLLPEPEAKVGNIKDPDKIAKKMGEAKAKQIRDMALSPLYGKIACCGFVGESIYTCAMSSEKDMIKAIFLYLEDFKIITWNGISFDIPFVYKRAMILGIKPPVRMSYWVKRYSTIPHCDLMQVWCNWYGYEKLDTVARGLLGKRKIDFDVTTISELLNSEKGRKTVSEYCLMDTKLIYELYNKFEGVLI